MRWWHKALEIRVSRNAPVFQGIQYPKGILQFPGQMPQAWCKAHLTQSPCRCHYWKSEFGIGKHWLQLLQSCMGKYWRWINFNQHRFLNFFIIPANRLCNSSLTSIQYFLFYIVSTMQNPITQISRLSCNIFFLVKGLHRASEAGAALNGFHCSVYTVCAFPSYPPALFHCSLQTSHGALCTYQLSTLWGKF